MKFLPGSPGVQCLGHLGISSLISLKNASLGSFWGGRWSCGVDRVCAAETPLAWQLISTGAEAELPGVGRAWVDVWGQGEGNSVGVNSCCSARVQAVFLPRSCDPQMDLQCLFGRPNGPGSPMDLPAYLCGESINISGEGPRVSFAE